MHDGAPQFNKQAGEQLLAAYQETKDRWMSTLKNQFWTEVAPLVQPGHNPEDIRICVAELVRAYACMPAFDPFSHRHVVLADEKNWQEKISALDRDEVSPDWFALRVLAIVFSLTICVLSNEPLRAEAPDYAFMLNPPKGSDDLDRAPILVGLAGGAYFPITSPWPLLAGYAHDYVRVWNSCMQRPE